MTESYATKTIAELAPLIEKKQVSPVEVAQAVIDRINTYEEKVNSYIEITAESKILEYAKEAEESILNGHYKGKLHGIPLALKDIFSVAGEVTTIGSKIHGDFVADTDATVVEKLKSAGAFFTGKLNLHEYASGGTTMNEHYGACRNPWDLSRIPGGSSGGSGAAVAADLTIASLGTDTGGSIRIPASANGIVGLKPTHGLVSKFGCFPLSWSLDHIGPMTKSVTDAAIILSEIVGYDSRDATSIKAPKLVYEEALTGDITGKVIGIEESYFFKEVDTEIAELVRQGIRTLEQMGAKIEIVKVPSLKYAEYAEFMTLFGETALIHKQNMLERAEDFGPTVRNSFLIANLITTDQYLEAQQIRRLMVLDFAEIWSKVDAIVAPTMPIIPFKIGENRVTVNGEEFSAHHSLGRLNGPANLLGLPSIAVPCGFSQGMPVGMQIIGAPLQEATILNLAYAFEQTDPLKGLKPTFDVVMSS